MSFDPDVTGDCVLIDGMEPVTLHSTSVVSVEGAKRGRLTLSETEFRQVGLEPTDMAWLLPEVSLAGVTPRRGDAIEDSSGAHWTILSVTKSPLSAVWRAVTRRQV
jgi:hypothetical protein